MEIDGNVRPLLLEGSGVAEEVGACANVEVSRKRSRYIEPCSSESCVCVNADPGEWPKGFGTTAAGGIGRTNAAGADVASTASRLELRTRSGSEGSSTTPCPDRFCENPKLPGIIMARIIVLNENSRDFICKYRLFGR
jgi:hypothetical protein